MDVVAAVWNDDDVRSLDRCLLLELPWKEDDLRGCEIGRRLPLLLLLLLLPPSLIIPSLADLLSSCSSPSSHSCDCNNDGSIGKSVPASSPSSVTVLVSSSSSLSITAYGLPMLFLFSSCLSPAVLTTNGFPPSPLAPPSDFSSMKESPSSVSSMLRSMDMVVTFSLSSSCFCIFFLHTLYRGSAFRADLVSCCCCSVAEAVESMELVE